MSSAVIVAGLGTVSAIGNNTRECLSSFESERTGIADASYLDSIHRQEIPLAEVKLSNEDMSKMSGFDAAISRTALLSFIAAREALEDAHIENIRSLRTGFISANTVGGMDKSEKFFSQYLNDPRKGRLREVVNHECGSVTELVAEKLHIRHHVSTISTACSSSANTLMFGARLIKHGILDVAVAGGADALTKFTLNGFRTLMILDSQKCKPFDQHRKGLNLGEGAGYVVLVSERIAEKLTGVPYCRLAGYCNRNDAHHQTASSPDGTGSWLAMKGALASSGLHPADIDYINLHGTGTANNDLAEGTAIQRLFDPNYPKMSSTKSFTGHTLGASGGIESVFSVLALKHGIIFPNLRLTTPMETFPFVPETQFLKNVPITNVLSNSFGFGGNCSSLIFSKI